MDAESKVIYLLLEDSIPEYGWYEEDDLNLLVERLTHFQCVHTDPDDLATLERVKNELKSLPLGVITKVEGRNMLKARAIHNILFDDGLSLPDRPTEVDGKPLPNDAYVQGIGVHKFDT